MPDLLLSDSTANVTPHLNARTDRASWVARLLMALASLLAAVADASGSEIPLDLWYVQSSIRSDAVQEATRHFRERVCALGGPGPAELGLREPALKIAVVDSSDSASFAGFSDSQRDECYLLEADSPRELRIRAITALGAVHGISDLETRLRVKSGKVRLAFPEWRENGTLKLLEKPAIATRGEYLNIGYDLPGITPHQWNSLRWQQYIDRLILARLNHWYFFLWIDAQSMFPGSRLSQRPGNRHLHEGLREAIRYAHRRGMKVTFMISPTMLPKDLWDAHPEWKADIVYAREGFACVCPNAPGAWEKMKAVWRSEMEWFRDADAVQIWFYDPGGCWCEKRGCKPHQAENLARQFREFGSMFRGLNPSAEIEYNLWPLPLWESEMKVKVREDLSKRVQAMFPNELNSLTAVGTPEGFPAPIPDFERRLGMRGSVFLFPTNPETSYVFPTPHLQYLRRSMQTVQRLGMDACFGHRLEAGTRYVGTFLMGHWMWNPGLPTDPAVRRFADWQTADENSGKQFAEAITVLDELTDKGIRPELGRKLEALMVDLWPHLPTACRDELEYWPAVASALRVIADSNEVEAQKLDAFAVHFAKALGTCKTFAPLLPRASGLFRGYRASLKSGWEKQIF